MSTIVGSLLAIGSKITPIGSGLVWPGEVYSVVLRLFIDMIGAEKLTGFNFESCHPDYIVSS